MSCSRFFLNLHHYGIYGTLLNVKTNNSNLTKSNLVSGVAHFRSPKHAGLDQATMLFVKHLVGKPESCFFLYATNKHTPPAPVPLVILAKKPSSRTCMLIVTCQNPFDV